MKRFIIGCMAMITAMLLWSCNDRIEVQKTYDFSLSSWYLPTSIAVDEPVEIRFTLDRSGDYHEASYQIGYIQLSGEGAVTDASGAELVSREFIPLTRLPGLNTANPAAYTFSLYYTNRTTKRAELRFIVRDSFGQERLMETVFNNKQG